MNYKRTEGIISIGISMATLGIADSFLKWKVGFLCNLINSKQDMRLKPIFAYTTLGIGFYFYIYIYYFLFLMTFKRM